MMWTKKEYELYFKTDLMDRINIVYDYFFADEEENNPKNNENIKEEKITENLSIDYNKTSILILYKDIETILIFGNKKSKQDDINQYNKEYMKNFIMNGFIIETAKISDDDIKFFQNIKDEKLKSYFNLFKKYKIIHGNSLNIISFN